MSKPVVHKAGGFFFTACCADWSYRLKLSYFWRDVTCKKCLRTRPLPRQKRGCGPEAS